MSYMSERSAPSSGPPGALMRTAFRMNGTVKTPRTFVVTVSMSARAPLPSVPSRASPRT